MNNIEEKVCLCALGRIFGFKPKTALTLINHYGSARAVFNMSEEELDLVLGPYSRYRSRICKKALDDEYTELIRLRQKGIHYIGITEEDYPHLLKECEDAPIGLYIRSESPVNELWNRHRSIGVVGTRDLSPYGRDWCERIIHALSTSNDKPTIVSGLALGTDICAHRNAIETGLPTIGVMATGPDSIYPSRNRVTAQQMSRTPGCALVTDFPPGTSPLAVNFLRRNRIIAGLSQATILIESKIKGGGMMTARLAFSYDREVHALPGRADDLCSQGCNRLIREKVADPITSIEELLESLGMTTVKKKSEGGFKGKLHTLYSSSMEPSRIDIMLSILNSIGKERGITLEEVADRTGIRYHMARNLCSMMETDGLIGIDLLQRCSIRTKNF